MYRLLLFTFFVSIESRYNYMFNNNINFSNNLLYKKPIKDKCCTEDPTKNLVKDLKLEDEIVRTFCSQEFDAREVYNYQGYEIKYKFKHNIENSKKIRINPLIIYINLLLEGDIEAKDVRILPEGLRTEDAVWRLDGDELTVTMPYGDRKNVEIPISCPRIEENPMNIDAPSDSRYLAYTYHRYGLDLKHLESFVKQE